APALKAELAVTDRVNSSMNAVQAAGPSSLRDALISESRCSELAGGDHTVLTSGDAGDHTIGIRAFLTHEVSKAPPPAPPPFIAGSRRPQLPTAGRDASI